MSIDRKRTFDDMFDCFTILSGEKYVSLYDAKTQVTRWSPNAVKMFDLPGEYFDQGAYNWEDSVHPDDRGAYRECMAKLTMGKISSYDISYRVRLFDGSYVMCRNRGAVIRSEEGVPDFIGGNVMNTGVLDRFDPLSGLKNSQGLMDDLEILIQNRIRKEGAALEIKDFGTINDAYGFSFGNKFLLKFASFLEKELEDKGEVYRLGGVKFVLLSDSLSKEEMDRICRNVSEKLNGRFAVDGIIHRTQLEHRLITIENFELPAEALLKSVES